MDSSSASSSSSSSSSSPPSSQWEYEVFLSFRGEDTRNTFTAHLCDALWRQGIKTFIDDPELRKGQFISPALLTAIENSMFCIIVLSTNYASSSWCLEELVKILESKTRDKERVLPIFYNVDPSDVRKQRGEFGKSFERLVENLTDPEMKERVETWKEALKQVAKIAGWDSRDRHEPSLIKEIISTIANKSLSRFSIDEENLAGIYSRIKDVMSLLCINSLEAITVGICGMGGVGKTTLANAVYCRIRYQFESSAFLENVGEDFKKQGLISLKQKLLSQLVDDGNLNIKGCTSLEGKLRWKKVLIVLDNVKDGALIEYLTANQNLLGPGSRIIVTTREKDLLTSYSVKHYEVKILNQNEAMQVLGKYSSKHGLPEDDLQELSGRIIGYAQGLPLALKILGPLLFGKKKPEWRSHLDKLESTPHPKIQQVLQISYDELDSKEKNIFLDIACFFKDEDKDRVMEIFGGCGFFPHSGIRTLLGKSLITISKNKLKMHDLIQAMAMEVVRQNSPYEPGKWSRLWSPEDVSHVLKKNTGTEEVEGIFLHLSNLREPKFTSEAFARMINLRLLKVYISEYSVMEERQVQFSQNFTFHSGDLRYLHWHGYSLRSLPVEFDPENLVELSMPYSHMNQLWEGKKDLEKLKFLDLSHSRFLKKIPDLSKATNLEWLVLEGCCSLGAVDPSVANLRELVHLSFRNCINLRYFSSSLELVSLEILILSGCSKLAKFPEIKSHMKHLKKLFLDWTAIEQLPSSIDRYAPGLVLLDLSNCKNLKNLPNAFCNLESLETLFLSGCSKLVSLPHDFGKLKKLRKLHGDRTALGELPDSFVDLRFTLQEVSFSGCKGSPTSASWILPRKKSYSLDFLLPQLSAFHSLEHVNLSNSNIKDGMLLHSLCLLSSLRKLDLSGNNFVRLPSSFSQLSQLDELDLQDCRRLQALPELPSTLTRIKATDCISLRKIPILLQADYIELTNCFKFEDHLSIMKSMLGYAAITHKFWSRLLDTEPPFRFETLSAVIPGNGIPEWFSHQNEGHEVFITPSPNQNSSHFLGFAFCVVLNPKFADDIKSLSVSFTADLYSLDGVSELLYSIFYFHIGSMKSDHLVEGLLYSPCYEEWLSIKISLTIELEQITDTRCGEITITKCGARLIYNEDMIEYMSAPQSSSVVLQELNNSAAEDIEVSRTS